MIYGYCRISRKTQSIDRQVRNICAKYENAKIIKEAFTGTKVEGRKEFNKLLNTVLPGDTIVFDSVSRMSRNAEEGWAIYEELFNKGVNIEFLKESFINTEMYKNRLENINIPNVEMEALNACSIAALTIYDMCKAVDKRMMISNIHLIEKTGGKSGDFKY